MQEKLYHGIFEAGQPLNTSDEDILNTTTLGVSDDAEPDVGNISTVPEPTTQYVLVTLQVYTQHNIDRNIVNATLAAQLSNPLKGCRPPDRRRHGAVFDSSLPRQCRRHCCRLSDRMPYFEEELMDSLPCSSVRANLCGIDHPPCVERIVVNL